MNRNIIPIIAVVLFEVMAFSMILPALPFLIKGLGGSNYSVTNIVGLFALTAFIFAPFWGGLSDSHGRKKILLLLLLVSALNYIWLGFATSLWMVTISRFLSGICAGWMGVAQSWIADITDKKNRTASLGLLGATFGVGFILGPALGGYLTDDGVQSALIAQSSVMASVIALLPHPHQLPLFLAGVITLLVAGVAWGILKKPPRPKIPEKNFSFLTVWQFLSRQKTNIKQFLLLVFLGQLAFSTLEAVFVLWGQANFHYNPKDIGTIFATIGMTTILVQGGLLRPLVKRFGERKLMQTGLIILVGAFALLNFLPRWWAGDGWVLVVVILVAFGYSLYQPSVLGALSKATKIRQGAILGFSQSLQSLARGLAAIFLGGLFTLLGNNIYLPPLLLFLLALTILNRTPNPSRL